MKKSPKKSRTLSWRRIAAGKWKTDLGGDFPEVIILELTNEEFQKNFRSKKAAKRFIDSLHILKRPLVRVVFADIVKARKNGNGWIVIGPHTSHSTIAIIAWQTQEGKS
jgi:hypothetical protein